MFSLFPRSNALRNWPLSLGLLFVAAPLISPSAKAQSASLKPDAPKAPDTPLLTDSVRPGSAIAASRRASLQKMRWRDRRSLVMSMPDTNVSLKLVSGTSAPIAAQPTAPKASAVQAPIAPPNVTPQSVPAAAPPLVAPKLVAPKVAVVPPTVKSATPDRLAAVGTIDPLPDWAKPTTRDKVARLPARGGPILNPSAVRVRPEAAVASPPPGVSETDRLMLAQLDADLAKAQRRLNRAESRLTEGQRQLGEFTGVLQSAMLEAGDDARGLHPFVRVAQRYLGTPYVWGGESARGFDCSGFIMRVMRDLGYRALPHSAAEQFRYGMPIAKPLLKPGDVVFFANTYKPGISHVGIYLGRGRFIHAANSKVGTIVSNLNEPKWIEKYAGARRLLPVNA
jgi:cell wall-associated NlpC family hydrolase